MSGRKPQLLKGVNNLKLKKSIQRQRRVICSKCEKVFRISKIHENKYKVDNKPYRYLYFECPFCGLNMIFTMGQIQLKERIRSGKNKQI